jgi:hypothetical protein
MLTFWRSEIWMPTKSRTNFMTRPCVLKFIPDVYLKSFHCEIFHCVIYFFNVMTIYT